MARTVIELWFKNYSDDENAFRNLGVSINEPLDRNFPNTQPHKVWICYPAASDWNIWVETIDLDLGDYKFIVGIDSPPGKEWLINLFVNGNEVIPQTTINNTSFAEGTTTISSSHPYASWKILQTGDKYCGPEVGGVIKCVKQNMETLNRVLLPRVASWDFCTAILFRRESLIVEVPVYSYMVNPNPTEWFLPVARIQNASDPSLHTTSLPVVFTAPYINGQFWEETMDFPMRWYEPAIPCPSDTCSYALVFFGYMRSNNSSIKLTADDFFLIQTGHLEGETPTLNEFYTDRGYQKLLRAKYVLDEFAQAPFNPSETCKLPQNPLKVQIDLSNTFFMLTAPTDLRVGRRIFSIITVKVVPEDAIGDTIPFLRAPEMPSFMNTLIIPMALGSEDAPRQIPTQFTLIITPEMMSKGGFTLQAGHLEPDPTKTSPAAPMIPVVDDSQFIPFNIRVESVILQKPMAIGSVTLQKPMTIKSVTLEKAKFVSITNVKLQKKAAPPPAKKATLTGRVLSLLGPVADAEVTLNGYTAKTDPTGSFTITGIPYGTYTLTVKPTRLHEKILFTPYTKQIDLYIDKSEIITLPVNLVNVGLAAGGTAAITAVLYKATAKPTPKYRF